MTVIFVSHGAPTLALDETHGAELRAWGESLEKPRAIVVVSAHWEHSPVTVGTLTSRPLIYDFSGFPPELYQVRYPAPGAPELLPALKSRLGGFTPEEDPQRGWDHGVWTPLVHLFPRADVPLIQLSIPTQESPRRLFELGQALAPFQEEGVMIMASGSLTHNLRQLDARADAPFPWAVEFDRWAAEVAQKKEWNALVHFRETAPRLTQAHPTDEHFLPLVVAAGAASTSIRTLRFPVQGFEYGSLSKRCFEWR